MTLNILFIAVGYLMGSICSAVIVSRLFGLPDPRVEGSKNPGATNVLRLSGKKYAALVLLADLLKGTIPVVIANIFGAGPITVAFTALAAVVGHMYPIFFGFKGGKGVATAIGALLGFNFIVGVMVSATWLLIANFSRYSSLASVVSLTLAPLYALLITGNVNIFPPLFIMVILILFKHRNNISRLIDGVEPKIKLKPNVIEEIMGPASNEEIVEHEYVAVKEEEPAEIPAAKVKVPAKTKKTSKTEVPIKKTKTTKAKISKAAESDKTVKKTTKKTTEKTTVKPIKKTTKKTTKKTPTIKSQNPK